MHRPTLVSATNVVGWWPLEGDRSLLCPSQNPAKRATADKILQHSWMKEHGTASSAPLDNIILKRMQVLWPCMALHSWWRPLQARKSGEGGRCVVS